MSLSGCPNLCDWCTEAVARKTITYIGSRFLILRSDVQIPFTPVFPNSSVTVHVAHIYTLLRELSMVERRCFPQMPRGLPPPPQSASSLFSGRTTLQCNSPSRTPYSLWDWGKARFLLKPHLCPAFPSGFPVAFPYLVAVKSVANKYLKTKQNKIYFGLSRRYDLMEADIHLSDG